MKTKNTKNTRPGHRATIYILPLIAAAAVYPFCFFFSEPDPLNRCRRVITLFWCATAILRIYNPLLSRPSHRPFESIPAPLGSAYYIYKDVYTYIYLNINNNIIPIIGVCVVCYTTIDPFGNPSSASSVHWRKMRTDSGGGRTGPMCVKGVKMINL